MVEPHVSVLQFFAGHLVWGRTDSLLAIFSYPLCVRGPEGQQMLQAQLSVLEIIEACRKELQWRGVQRVSPQALSWDQVSSSELCVRVRWTWRFHDGETRVMPDIHYGMLLKSTGKLPKIARIDANSLTPSGIVGSVSIPDL